MKKNSGFSIIEVVLTMFLIGVIGGALVSLQYIFGKSQLQLINNSINVQHANSGMFNLSREIRTMRGGDNGAFPIEYADSQTLIFYSDVDFDGMAEKVRYFVENGAFKKATIEPQGYPVTYPTSSQKIKIITEYLRNESTPIFYYFNENYPLDPQGNPMNYPADILRVKLIRIYLRVNQKDNELEKDYILDSFSQIRTIKEN